MSKYLDLNGLTVLWNKIKQSFLSLGGGIIHGNITANNFIKSGGTSKQFLKADGSVDGNSYLLKSSYTAADVLSKIKTVDGSDSGLDADLLDGYHASSFSLTSHTHNSILDVNNSLVIAFAYSKESLNYGDTEWLGGWAWNDSVIELRAIARNQFLSTAAASSTYVKKSGDTMTGALTVLDNIKCNNIIQSSDKRNKENIQDISTDKLNKLSEIQYKQFNYKDSETTDYGVIAQDILKLNIPNLVRGTEEISYAVNYNNLFILEIINLKNEIKKLKEQLNNE